MNRINTAERLPGEHIFSDCENDSEAVVTAEDIALPIINAIDRMMLSSDQENITPRHLSHHVLSNDLHERTEKIIVESLTERLSDESGHFLYNEEDNEIVSAVNGLRIVATDHHDEDGSPATRDYWVLSPGQKPLF